MRNSASAEHAPCTRVIRASRCTYGGAGRRDHELFCMRAVGVHDVASSACAPVVPRVGIRQARCLKVAPQPAGNHELVVDEATDTILHAERDVCANGRGELYRRVV